jgi:hypothetical protein
VPPNIDVQAKQHRGNEAAAYLEGIAAIKGSEQLKSSIPSTNPTL